VAARQQACAGMDLAEIARLPASPGAPDTGEPGCDLLAVLQHNNASIATDSPCGSVTSQLIRRNCGGTSLGLT
jgi:hypothetical protein